MRGLTGRIRTPLWWLVASWLLASAPAIASVASQPAEEADDSASAPAEDPAAPAEDPAAPAEDPAAPADETEAVPDEPVEEPTAEPEPAAPARGTGMPAGLSRGEEVAWEAGQYVDHGQFAAAEAKASLALSIEGGAAAGHYQLARLRLRQGDLPAARREARSGIEADPRYVPAHYLLIRLDAAGGPIDDDAHELERLVATHPDDLGLQLCLAEAQLVGRKYEAAIRTITAVLKRAETSVAAMKILARVYRDSGKGATAKAILERTFELQPDAEAMLIMATIHMASDELSAARRRLEEAVGLDPTYVEALNNLGVIYARVRNWEAAQDVLTKATSFAPSFPAAWLNLGSAQRGAGRFEAAEASWRKAISLDPKMAEPWYDLGILFLENKLEGRELVGRLKEAIAAFNEYKRRVVAAQGQEVDPFIEEANLLIQQEKQRKEEELKALEEEAAMEAEGAEDAEADEEGDAAEPDEGVDEGFDDGASDDSMDDGTADDDEAGAPSEGDDIPVDDDGESPE